MENWIILMSVAAAAVVVMFQIPAAMGELHKVGGSRGWTNHDVNYTQWSAHEQVFLGDWLIFNFDKRYFSVLEVNETSYEKCISEGFLKNWTRGGRDVAQMTELRTYYFLSGGGYCFGGMKVAVRVEQPRDGAAPAPSPTSSASALSSPLFPYTRKHGIPPSLLHAAMAFMMLWGFLI